MTLFRIFLYNFICIIVICLIYLLLNQCFEFKLDKTNVLSMASFIAMLIALNINWIKNLILPIKVSCNVERFNSEICLKVVFSNPSKVGVKITDIQIYGYTNTILPFILEKESLISHSFCFNNFNKRALEGRIYLTIKYYYPSNNIRKHIKLTINE